MFIPKVLHEAKTATSRCKKKTNVPRSMHATHGAPETKAEHSNLNVDKNDSVVQRFPNSENSRGL